MDPSGEDRAPGRLLPDEARPCVWMTAGIVAYKICDRDFDCEHCPLDAGLRGYERADAPIKGASPDAVRREFDFPDDRLYHPAHTWSRPLDAGRVTCGADAFAAWLLAHASSIILPAPGATLRQGGVAFWLVEEHRLFPLVSPVTGSVCRRNPRVQETPTLLSGSPYDEGWLLEVDCPDWDEQRGRLLDARRQREAALRQASALNRHVAHALESPVLGPTMADGGESRHPRDVLGPQRFHRLVRHLLR